MYILFNNAFLGFLLKYFVLDSQIPGDPQVYFELVNGRTEQTNKEATFRAVINEKHQNQVNTHHIA